MAIEEKKYGHLTELGGSDYEIVDGEPDIRGWKVKNETGQLIGTVEDLLFEPQSQQVRYIIVDLDDADFGIEDDKKIAIPIGLASLYDGNHIQASNDEPRSQAPSGVPVDTDVFSADHKIGMKEYTEENLYNPLDDGEVVVIAISSDQLIRLPAYQKDGLSPEIEVAIRNIFEGTGEVDAAASKAPYDTSVFYNHNYFDEDKFYARGRSVGNESSNNLDREGKKRLKPKYGDEGSIDPNESTQL